MMVEVTGVKVVVEGVQEERQVWVWVSVGMGMGAGGVLMVRMVGGVRVGVGAEEEEVVVSAVVRAVEDVVAEERVMRGMRARGIGEGVEGMYGVGAEVWEVLG